MVKLDGMDGEMLKWMVASAIKYFQRCPTDQLHEELTQPNVNKARMRGPCKPVLYRSLPKKTRELGLSTLSHAFQQQVAFEHEHQLHVVRLARRSASLQSAHIFRRWAHAAPKAQFMFVGASHTAARTPAPRPHGASQNERTRTWNGAPRLADR